MNDVVDTILHDYPYPIAKCYERVVGARDAAERWNSTRYLLEVTLKYCACVTVTQYLKNDNLDDKTNASLTCLRRPSLGHWLNLFIRCAKRNQEMNQPFFNESTFLASQDRPAIAAAHQAMVQYRDNKSPGMTQSLTLGRFLETWVAYRNRTSGHGAPSADHIIEIAPVLQDAAVELLLSLEELKRSQLIYLSNISLQRKSYIHSLTRLMGTTQVPMPDFVCEQQDALVGYDKQLFLALEGDDRPFASLHPLAIYSGSEVFLLHHIDLSSSVDYICHHTGAYYSADRIYEDFRERLGSFLGSSNEKGTKFEAEDVYKESVRMSLMDGVLSNDEQAYLVELRGELQIADDVADLIEQQLKEKMPVITQAAPATTTGLDATSAVSRLSARGSQLKANSEPTRLLFFSYASVDDSFWGGLVARFSSAAYQRDYVLSLVATDPADHHDVSAMSNLVADMDRIVQLHKPDLLLMVPFPSDTFSQLFQKRFQGFNIPVLTVDTEFSESLCLDDVNGGHPAAVLLDNTLGGRLAADALLATHEAGDPAPRYLVMPGLTNATHSQQRVSGFTERVKEAHPEAKVRILPEGLFDRHRARQLIEDFLEDVDISRYNGIFCCNDGMALGVYEAIIGTLVEGQSLPPFFIVGFNNTVEYQSVMSIDPYKLLLATVDQALDTYSDTIFSTVDALLAGQEVEKRILIKPQLAYIHGGT